MSRCWKFSTVSLLFRFTMWNHQNAHFWEDLADSTSSVLHTWLFVLCGQHSQISALQRLYIVNWGVSLTFENFARLFALLATRLSGKTFSKLGSIVILPSKLSSELTFEKIARLFALLVTLSKLSSAGGCRFVSSWLFRIWICWLAECAFNPEFAINP